MLTALRWLQTNNHFYSNIIIDHAAIQALPEDGIPEGLIVEDDQGSAFSDVDVPASPASSHSFLPLQQNVATEDEAIRATINGHDPLDWPNIANEPINEFQTSGLATMCFPTLFPYGLGDPTCSGRLLPVTLTEAFKHLIKYADNVDGKYHWRFASHPRFPYWALNMKLRHQLITQSSVYLHHHPADANLTVEELRDMVGHLDADSLMQRLQRYTAKVQGSNSYWYQRCSELRTLIEQKGPPTFFWTVSSADNFWPELHKLMPYVEGEEISHGMRVQAVIDNPHITDWFFSSKLSDWLHHWLYDSLAIGAEWHWYRYEYQARGSTHAHGCAKLSNDPGLCKLVEKVAAAWAILEEPGNGDIDVASLDENDKLIVQEGQEAKAEVLQYADWLVTTCNSSMPDETWCMPVPHPCAVPINSVDDLDDDYYGLVNSVERHTRCSAAYCLKKKADQADPECRFKYPRPTSSESMISFERLADGTVRATLTTKRDDPRVNSHNRLLLQNWRANVDIQIIIDVQACVRYMAKYASKGEPRSQAISEIFKSSVGGIPQGSDGKSILRRAMIRSVGERDFSAQETAHMLLSLPLVSCTYSFFTLSLKQDHQVVQDTGQLVIKQSLIDHYCIRTAHMDTSLLKFAAEFSISKGEIKRRSSPVIVRTFPQYSPNPSGDSYDLYCKYQLIKHKPWHTDMSNAWGGGEGSSAVWISQYQNFLLTDAARECIPHVSQELHAAEQQLAQLQEGSSDESESDDNDDDHLQDDWMQLCQLYPRFSLPSSSEADGIDWAEDAREMPPDLLRECPKWISTQRHLLVSDSHVHTWERQLDVVDVAMLNVKQRCAYDLVQHHYAQLMAGESPVPLCMIVSGTAGTGKSFLISALAQLLGNSCLLTATTGMASFNICGKTLHSALQLPVRSIQHELQGATLQRLQLRMKDKCYLIIDEMSMIGHRMMAWVDKRLRQATGKLDSPLGGVSVILIGDFGQLPPVCDRPLYAEPTSNALSSHGHSVYQMFDTVVMLDQVLRQSGMDPETQIFRELLLRLRDGSTTQEDWQMLLTRDPSTADNRGDFSDAVHLYYDKASVVKYNLDKLQSLGSPIARVNGIHSTCAAASANADDAGGLHAVIFIAVGAPVMLTANLWQEVGLCNGAAAGIVYKILYQEGQGPPNLPIAVLVDFDQYSGPPFIVDRPKCIPIPPTTFEWDSGVQRLSRQQLPLQLRYAITIHKCQGQTLQKAVIDIGKSELAAGCTFVALSRLPSLRCGLIQPMSFQRLKSISNGRNFLLRQNEEKRLQDLAIH